jgi:hypothetical protein
MISDKQYFEERLDHEHVLGLAETIKLRFANGAGAVEACYQPGDGTWYALLFARPELVGAAGGGTQGNSPSTQVGRERMFVSYLQQSTWASFGELDDPYWIAGKLTDNEVGIVALAAILKEVM